MISQQNKTGLRNPWFLGMIALIILVLGVNGAFIWFAIHQRSTLVDKDYNTNDRKSNASMIGELQNQKALAWKITINQPKQIVMNQPISYKIIVMDQAGAPVSGTVEVKTYRASDESRDTVINFSETSPGNYQGYIAYPLKGFWELRIRIKRGEEIFEVNTDRFSVAVAS
jgi:nitrogen fixation protein FixH